MKPVSGRSPMRVLSFSHHHRFVAAAPSGGGIPRKRWISCAAVGAPLLWICLATDVYAAGAAAPISWFTLLMGLVGGLALFLAGLEQLADGLKRAAGGALKRMLGQLTTNRIMGALTGAFVTGALNSSSITTVLVVGFVTAGTMTLTQSVGVIMGANIGSTVTAQILAFNVSQYALLPVAVGFFLMFVKTTERRTQIGMMIMGLGLVFFGMGIMSSAMAPLRSYEPFIEMLRTLRNPLAGLLVGALFTGVVQSSAATVGIAIALASEGFLTLEAGVAVALGANLGTCITAMLAAIGKPPEAVRAAVVHVIFNVLGVLVWFFFIGRLTDIAVWLSPTVPELSGTAKLAAEVPRQIANANTFFNVVNTCLFLPFAGLFAWGATKLIPDRPTPPGPIEPQFLDPALIAVPDMALVAVRRELTRTAEITLSMFTTLGEAFNRGSMQELRTLAKEDDKIDTLESACMAYLNKVRQQPLNEGLSEEHRILMVTAVSLETLADVIETDLVELGAQALALDYRRSRETQSLLFAMYQCVHISLVTLIEVLRTGDQTSIEAITQRSVELKQVQRDFVHRKADRLCYVNEAALKSARLEISISEKLFRMQSLIKRIAHEYLAVEKARAAAETTGDDPPPGAVSS
jgi:phosphate:Na+ symporter